MTLALIVAVSENNVIGRTDGSMVWHLRDDLLTFKRLTTGHPIIMGHTTYAAIGKLLPDRTTIIVTRQPNLVIPGAIIAHSPNEALKLAQQLDETVYVIGGAQIYRSLINEVDTLYVAHVHATVVGDVLFNPLLRPLEWRRIASTDVAANEHNDYSFTQAIYKRV